MDRKMNFFIMCFIFIIILAFTSYISYSQSLITSSTTWGTEIVIISPDTYTPKISELLRGTGLDEITCKFITLDGKNNEIKINVPFLSSEFDLDTGGGELKAGFEVVNLFISSSRGEKNNWVGVEGKLGGHAIRFELSFKPGFKAITSSTAQDPNNLTHTTFRIRLFNKDNNTYKTLFEKSTTEWEKTDKNEIEIAEIKIAITSMINNFVDASDSQDWEQAKKYCLPGSQIYSGLEEAQNNTSKPTSGMKTTSQLVIDKISVNNFTAVAYCNVSTIMTFNGKNIRKDDAEATMFLEKVDNKWKLSEVQSKIINTIRGSGSDYIKILSVTPDSGLIDGVDTDFEVVVEYKLVSSKRGGINICFNNGKELENYYASTSNHISVDKGTGTHIFNVSEKPKNWGSLNDFKVCACLGVIGEKVNYYLDQDFKILNFN